MRFVDTFGVRSRFDERVPARDGIELSADVYLPPSPGTYPVLVTRTPYDNNRTTRSIGGTTLPPAPADRYKKLAAHGFVVVAGDVRGRGDAGGVFTPFVHEAADGADLVRWACDLPESNGRVGLFGAGYAGFTALAAAAHPAVEAVTVWSPFGAGDGLPTRDGAVRLDWLFWMHLVGGRTPQPVDVPLWREIFGSRPLARMHEALGREDVAWPEWAEHPDPDDDHWSALRLGGVTAPTMFVTGWWDGGLGHTLRHWAAARTSSAAAGHRLLVGPWDSAAVRRPRPDTGGVEWGPASVVDPDELLVGWCSRHLREEAGPETAPVRVFVTGRNEWQDLDDWPGAAGSDVLWLSSGGRANTRRGDGRLLREAPPGQAADRFVHHPDDPVPWQPGPGSFSRNAPMRFTLDSAFATSRDDTCVYTGDPVTAPMMIQGRPRVTLWAETDAADTDWVVCVEDVFPGGGRSVHLAHGIVRARSRPGFAPGRAVPFELSLTDVAHELLPGHALRLVVSSALFPLYAVNLGGTDYAHGTEPAVAVQTVHHGGKHASRIELPLAGIPGRA